ncbi:hypothetical protein [Marinilabilia rubra]|uniref:Uncharacterized protein n=1 Tax=Marinilabilia rubra TaxID=2162893 RepID=A0A2U2B988_9BACT|nr:hypothetical protein [Marinilabilia rubra]PWD99630.1 hypothetical protein DDZ16_09290 [Marinilabilia rubra]
MKKIKLTVLLLGLMAAASSQSSTKPHVAHTNYLKTTDVKVDYFKIKEAVTVYEPALNLSYFHHLLVAGCPAGWLPAKRKQPGVGHRVKKAAHAAGLTQVVNPHK